MKNKFWIYLIIIAFIASISGYLITVNLGIFQNQKINQTTVDNKKVELPPEKKQIYRCPMHPHIVSDHPGTCPICHMDLQLVEEESLNTANPISSPVSNISGRDDIELGFERQQLIGVTFGTVSKKNLIRKVRATGKVAFDPELYTAIEEYRQAYATWKQVQSGSVVEMKKQIFELLQSSRTKLKLLGLNESKIDKIKDSYDNSLNLLLPQGKAWIYAEVFEHEMSGIKVGQKILATIPSKVHETFVGNISSISPVLNGQSRTIRVRAEVPDPKGILRPDTFMNVTIEIEFGEKLAIPEDSILFSEGDSFVFLVKDNGKFIPKRVTLGEKTQDYYEVVEGLNENDKIVTSANFLIDSESKLKSVLNRALKNTN